MTPEHPYGWWLPLDISTHGAGLDSLFYIVHWFMLALFLGWGAFFVYCLVRFRAREGYKAQYATDTKHLNTYLEVAVVAFEVALIFVFSIPLWAHAKYQLPKPVDAMEIEVTAEQFAWNVRYPGPDGKFGKKSAARVDMNNPIGLDREDPDAKDDIVVANELHVPTGKPVIVHLTSKDVIHSFFLPVVRVKQDAVPGQLVDVWFEATQAGNFQIACAQLCGVAHSLMVGEFKVHSPEEFDAWLKQKGEGAREAAKAAAPKTSDW